MKDFTILLVDDEENILKSLGRLLRSEGYRILTAQSGEEGLLKLEDDEYMVDLVISDHLMPAMSGIEFLKRVRVEHPHVLTIMLTGHSELDTVIEAVNEAGIYKFILKPWNNEDLRQTVKRALELKTLVMERDSLLQKIKTKDVILKELERKHPGITKAGRDDDGSALD
jgi:DNA-binding NtrC family response regulator